MSQTDTAVDPDGYRGELRPRSRSTAHHQLVLVSPGVVCPRCGRGRSIVRIDYRGAWKTWLHPKWELYCQGSDDCHVVQSPRLGGLGMPPVRHAAVFVAYYVLGLTRSDEDERCWGATPP